MDEDLYYQQIMTETPRRPSRPPPYQVEDPKLHDNGAKAENSLVRSKDEDKDRGKVKSVDKNKSKSKGKGKGKGKSDSNGATAPDIGNNHGVDRVLGTQEALPAYSSSIELEGIFMKKHEIEDTTKRAEDRRWHTTFVTLTGTALNLYTVKKTRTWGKTRDGPTISPDNPPWMRKSKLEKSYSLLYADAGIAADYKK